MVKKKLFPESLLLSVIFLLAFTIRIIFLMTYPRYAFLSHQLFTPDEKTYNGYAQSLLSGEGFIYKNLPARVPPLYPFFLFCIYRVFGISYSLARIIQAVLGALTCIVIYFLGKEMFNKRVGLISATVSLFYYSFIQLSGYLSSETLYTLLLLTALFFFLRFYRSSSWVYLVGGNFFLGLSILCRDLALLLIPIILLWLSLSFQISLKEKGKQILLSLLILSLILGPWIYRNFRIFHSFVLISVGAGHQLYLGNSPHTTGGTGGHWRHGIDDQFPSDIQDLWSLETDRLLQKKALQFILTHPQRFFQLFLKKMVNMWRPFYAESNLISKIVMSFSYLPVMGLGIWGIFHSLKRDRKLFLLPLVLLIFTISHGIGVSTIRYRYPLMPIFVIYASFTLSWIWDLLRKGRSC